MPGSKEPSGIYSDGSTQDACMGVRVLETRFNTMGYGYL